MSDDDETSPAQPGPTKGRTKMRNKIETGCKAKFGKIIVTVGVQTKTMIGGPHRHTSAGVVAESLLTRIN